MNKFIATVLAACAFAASSLAFAVPSAAEVENAMRAGNWQQADTQLQQVIEAHPNNAHAHYLYGQVLAREGRPADGLAELEKARALDPQLKFAGNPSKFAAIESRMRGSANRAVNRASPTAHANGAPADVIAQNGGPIAAETFATPLAPRQHDRPPSMGLWIGIAVVLAAIALVLRFTLRRARANGDERATEARRTQLKRATELLNAIRTLKLDIRLSTAPGHDVMQEEAEDIEAQLRGLVDKLSNGNAPVPDYELEALERRIESLKARADGRVDPDARSANAFGHGGAPSGAESAYAQEAERLSRNQGVPGGYGPGYGAPAPAQQPPIIVQQPGALGGLGGGLGGLAAGVLLGEMLSGNRDRVVERDVLVDDQGGRIDPGFGSEDPWRQRSADPGIDVGQGSDNWDDGSGGIDVGSDGSDDNWS
jgi:tetratricopeptide (TPR) repeat protein